MFRLALTGSIGMGKSTVAAMFSDAGVPVWDADAAVHRMYQPGGAAVAPIGQRFPSAIRGGAVDRVKLRALLNAPEDFDDLNAIVHPLVAMDRDAWSARQSADIALFDIPLLFETGNTDEFDAVVVVDVDTETQRTRVLERPGMTEDIFEQILARQMPNSEKVKRANFVIPTRTLEESRARVLEILSQIRESLTHA